MAWIVTVFLRFLLLLIVPVNAGVQNEMEGTLLFLHVWKCGGTTLRQLMCDWANREGLSCATVATCGHLSLKVNMLPCRLVVMQRRRVHWIEPRCSSDYR